MVEVDRVGKTALVTGAHEGIGRTVADALAETGYRVFGTSRSARPDRDGVAMLRLDVREQQSVTDCVGAIQESAGPIDVLVSNAGLTVVSPSEETPLTVAHDMMEVNFYGAARLVNAALPAMRAQRAGHLVFISSLAGRMGVPGQSYYCASKHALEGYVDGLYAELQMFGIKVSLLEPGHFRTNIIEKSTRPDWPTLEAYDPVRDHLREVVMKATAEGADPRLIANVVLKAIQSRRPRLRYRVDGDGKRAMFFKSVLPEAMFYSVVAKRFGMSLFGGSK
ncbi:MAG: SDR family NAD(P)-dependent oxidoreductase [Planctomycetota bacterium]